MDGFTKADVVIAAAHRLTAVQNHCGGRCQSCLDTIEKIIEEMESEIDEINLIYAFKVHLPTDEFGCLSFSRLTPEVDFDSMSILDAVERNNEWVVLTS